MNLQDILLISTVFVIFAVGLSGVYYDMGQKKLNLNQQDIDSMNLQQQSLQIQEDNYNKNLGNKNINYSASPESLTGYNFESITGFGILSGIFDVGGVFGGFTGMVKSLFPESMSGFILWFLGIILSLFSVFVGFEIYYTIRGNKSK